MYCSVILSFLLSNKQYNSHNELLIFDIPKMFEKNGFCLNIVKTQFKVSINKRKKPSFSALFLSFFKRKKTGRR